MTYLHWFGGVQRQVSHSARAVTDTRYLDALPVRQPRATNTHTPHSLPCETSTLVRLVHLTCPRTSSVYHSSMFNMDAGTCANTRTARACRVLSFSSVVSAAAKHPSPAFSISTGLFTDPEIITPANPHTQTRIQLRFYVPLESTQNRSFWRRSSQPICTEERKPGNNRQRVSRLSGEAI